MRTLNFVKVAVFALTIGIAIFIGTNLYGKTPEVHTRYTPLVPAVEKVSKIDEYWLALNLYYEAGSEPRIGKIAVGIVTLNRMKDSRYPKTIKDVVTEPNQFSWYNNKIVRTPANSKTWQDCLEISRMLLTRGANNDIITMLEGATHFHTVHVKPAWAVTKVKIVQIGDHIFYRYDDNVRKIKI